MLDICRPSVFTPVYVIAMGPRWRTARRTYYRPTPRSYDQMYNYFYPYAYLTFIDVSYLKHVHALLVFSYTGRGTPYPLGLRVSLLSTPSATLRSV